MNYQKELEKILSKSNIKGKDLGRAYLLDILYNYEKGNGLLINAKELETLAQQLPPSQYKIHLAGYKVACNLPNLRNIVNAYIQQFLKEYYQRLLPLQAVYNAEKIEANQAKTPLIVTESAYKRLKKETLEVKRQEVLSLYDVVVLFIDNIVKQLENGESPAIPNNILEAIENTKSQPVDSEYLTRSWNIRTRSGDYSKYHDKILSATEKLEAVNDTRYFEREIELYKGVDYIVNKYNIPAELIKQIPKEYQEEVFKFIQFNKCDLEEIEIAFFYPLIKDIKSYIYKHSSDVDSFFKCKPINKYDLLVYAKDYFSFLNTLYVEENLTAFFICEYHELFKACEDYILSQAGLKTITDSAPIPLTKPVLPIGLLADSGIDVFKKQLEITNQEIINYYLSADKYKKTQANYKGIAVINDNSDVETVKGIYKTPKEIAKGISLESLKENADKLDNVKLTTTSTIKPSIIQIYAYNELLKQLGLFFNVDFSPIYIDMGFLENYVNDNYNSVLAYYYCNVVGNRKEKQVKRAMIKELFPLINLQEYKPTEEAINTCREQLESVNLEDTTFFNNLNYVINDLAGGLQ